MLELTATSDGLIRIHLAPTTLKGKPAVVQEGSQKCTVLSGNGKVVAVEGDPNAFDLWTPDDDFNDTTFSVEADADVDPADDKVDNIEDQVVLHCVHPRAKFLGLTADLEQLKP